MEKRTTKVPAPKRSVHSGTTPLKEEVELATLSSPRNYNAALPIVQFTAPMYYVEESEQELTVDIMRMGSLSSTCSVRYRTKDGTAKAGQRYNACSGVVHFSKLDHTKSIKIGIIETESSSATLEFKIELSDGDGCEIGQYLHHCRVKVIDKDLFPTNKYWDEFPGKPPKLKNIPDYMLFIDFFWQNYSHEGIAWRTILTIIFDQLKNIYIFITLYIDVYVVDVLFNLHSADAESRMWIKTGPYGGRVRTAELISALYIVPMGILHLWSFTKIYVDLKGMCITWLRVNLFRKYLNYTLESRMTVNPARMELALLAEIREIAEGYEAAIGIARQAGLLLVLGFFILCSQNPRGLITLVTMPILMFVVVACRSRSTNEITEGKTVATSKLIGLVAEVCEKYGLIADYQQRPHMGHEFEERNERELEFEIQSDVRKLNTKYFAKWLGPCVIGFYFATNAVHVLDGRVSLGTFLAALKVFRNSSELSQNVYVLMLKITLASRPLKRVSLMMNMPTDLLLWKTANRTRREQTKKARSEALQGSEGLGMTENGSVAIDTLEIKLKGVCFAYPGNDLLSNVDLSCPQGKLVAVIGAHGSGKATFLNLLGHTIFPQKGFIFIPTHLRVLHVSDEPVVLSLSLWENLTFGYPNADPHRVIRIMDRMGMNRSAEILKSDWTKRGGPLRKGHDIEHGASPAEEEEEPSKWVNTVSKTELLKIHLARAFIMNPEVLILHRPFSHFDEDECEVTYDLFLEHVKHRGLEISNDSEEKRGRRRPRTAIFTPNSIKQANKADLIWKVISRTQFQPGCVKVISQDMLEENKQDIH